MQFLQYVRFYKMLNELPMGDRPGDDVFEDDVELDKWYNGYIRKLAKDSGTNLPVHNAQPREMYEG